MFFIRSNILNRLEFHHGFCITILITTITHSNWAIFRDKIQSPHQNLFEQFLNKINGDPVGSRLLYLVTVAGSLGGRTADVG